MYASRRSRAAWQWHPSTLLHEDPVPLSVEHGARSLVYPSRHWSGFDNAGVESGKSPQARAVVAVGDRANQVSTQGRMLFCQAIADADSPTVTTDPLFRFAFPERNPHGTERVYVALCLPRAVAATSQYFGRSPQGPFARGGGGQTPDAVSSPVYLATSTLVEQVIVGHRAKDIDVLVANGLRLVGLCCYERSRVDGALNASLDVFDPQSVAAGTPIRDGPLRKIRRSLESSWRNQRNVVAGAVVGNATTCRITGTTATNIFDRTSTSRTANTPGVLIDEYLGGLAHEASVAADCAVYASITGGAAGTVLWISSVNQRYVTVDSTTPRWYRTADGVPLYALNGTRGAGAASEKVDIHAAAGTGGQSIDVFAWSICTRPA